MIKKIIIIFFVIFIIAAGLFIFSVYSDNIKGNEDIELYISSGSSYEDLLNTFESSNILKNVRTFNFIATGMKYPQQMKAGKYLIDGNTNNRDLVVMLRRGEQEPVTVVIHNERTIADLAGKISGYLEGDSLQFLNFLTDDQNLSRYGYSSEKIMTAFIPNTYYILWNTSPEQFLERMLHERSRFWNAERKEKAKDIGLSENDVFILASIVEQEINMQSEASRIAGVYLNRLNKNMLLQADPTLKFAIGDFGIRRILNEHKTKDSPYNTYKYKGLPPGPICLPSINTIDDVLNAEDHSYYYFCAKADLSGGHHFSSTYAEHLQHARAYQTELNRTKIYR